MKLEKAKEILSAYRPEHYDDSDTLMNEALKMTETNTELRNWFEEQLAIDTQIFDAFSSIPDVGDDRKDSLLGDYQNIQESKISWFKPILAIAAIALFTLLCFGLGHHRNYKNNFEEFESFRSAMSYFAASPYVSLDIKSQDLSELRSWLESNNLPLWSQSDLSTEILQETPVGCAEILWRDIRVSLTCFHNSEGEIIHLFSINSEASSEALTDDIEALARTHDLQSVGWHSSGQTFLLMGSEPHITISKYISTEA
ncbi:MAG: hypothetical protein ACPGN3_16100 [Opitutales bacterium]